MFSIGSDDLAVHLSKFKNNKKRRITAKAYRPTGLFVGLLIVVLTIYPGLALVMGSRVELFYLRLRILNPLRGSFYILFLPRASLRVIKINVLQTFS
jgi:hypothetical protein